MKEIKVSVSNIKASIYYDPNKDYCWELIYHNGIQQDCTLVFDSLERAMGHIARNIVNVGF